MIRRSGFRVLCRILCLCLLALILASCGESEDKYIGVYRAETAEGAKQREVILELRANGEGVWKAGPDGTAGSPPVEIPLTWYIKRGALRINTKEGGVIVGRITKETIEITLPGPKTLIFKKTG